MMQHLLVYVLDVLQYLIPFVVTVEPVMHDLNMTEQCLLHHCVSHRCTSQAQEFFSKYCSTQVRQETQDNIDSSQAHKDNTNDQFYPLAELLPSPIRFAVATRVEGTVERPDLRGPGSSRDCAGAKGTGMLFFDLAETRPLVGDFFRDRDSLGGRTAPACRTSA